MNRERSTAQCLQDVVQYIVDIQRFIGTREFSAFANDLVLQRAVLYSAIAIGEAIKLIDPIVREANPDVNWKGPAKFRDLLAHSYFVVDPKVVWETAQNHYPKLREQVETILAQLGHSKGAQVSEPPRQHDIDDDEEEPDPPPM